MPILDEVLRALEEKKKNANGNPKNKSSRPDVTGITPMQEGTDEPIIAPGSSLKAGQQGVKLAKLVKNRNTARTLGISDTAPDSYVQGDLQSEVIPLADNKLVKRTDLASIIDASKNIGVKITENDIKSLDGQKFSELVKFVDDVTGRKNQALNIAQENYTENVQKQQAQEQDKINYDKRISDLENRADVINSYILNDEEKARINRLKESDDPNDTEQLNNIYKDIEKRASFLDNKNLYTNILSLSANLDPKTYFSNLEKDAKNENQTKQNEGQNLRDPEFTDYLKSVGKGLYSIPKGFVQTGLILSDKRLPYSLVNNAYNFITGENKDFTPKDASFMKEVKGNEVIGKMITKGLDKFETMVTGANDFKQNWGTQFAQGLGSFAGFMLSGSVANRVLGELGLSAKAIEILSPGLTGALSEAGSDAYDMYEKTGNFDKSVASFLAGIPIGFTESIGLGQYAGKINPVKAFTKESLMRVIGESIKETIEEGGQEAVQQYLQQSVNNYLDPEHKQNPLFQLKDAFTTAGVLGAIMPFTFKGLSLAGTQVGKQYAKKYEQRVNMLADAYNYLQFHKNQIQNNFSNLPAESRDQTLTDIETLQSNIRNGFNQLQIPVSFTKDGTLETDMQEVGKMSDVKKLLKDYRANVTQDNQREVKPLLSPTEKVDALNIIETSKQNSSDNTDTRSQAVNNIINQQNPDKSKKKVNITLSTDSINNEEKKIKSKKKEEKISADNEVFTVDSYNAKIVSIADKLLKAGLEAESKTVGERTVAELPDNPKKMLDTIEKGADRIISKRGKQPVKETAQEVKSEEEKYYYHTTSSNYLNSINKVGLVENAFISTNESDSEKWKAIKGDTILRFKNNDDLQDSAYDNVKKTKYVTASDRIEIKTENGWVSLPKYMKENESLPKAIAKGQSEDKKSTKSLKTAKPSKDIMPNDSGEYSKEDAYRISIPKFEKTKETNNVDATIYWVQLENNKWITGYDITAKDSSSGSPIMSDVQFDNSEDAIKHSAKVIFDWVENEYTQHPESRKDNGLKLIRDYAIQHGKIKESKKKETKPVTKSESKQSDFVKKQMSEFDDKIKQALEDNATPYVIIKRNLPGAKYTYEGYNVATGEKIVEGYNAMEKLSKRKGKYTEAKNGYFIYESGDKFTIEDYRRRLENYNESLDKNIKESETKKENKPAPTPTKKKLLDIDESIDDVFNAFEKSIKGKLSAGLDPEQLSLGLKLVGLYTQKGFYKFKDVIEDIYNRYGKDRLTDLYQYIKVAYANSFMSDNRENQKNYDNVYEVNDLELETLLNEFDKGNDNYTDNNKENKLNLDNQNNDNGSKGNSRKTGERNSADTGQGEDSSGDSQRGTTDENDGLSNDADGKKSGSKSSKRKVRLSESDAKSGSAGDELQSKPKRVGRQRATDSNESDISGIGDDTMVESSNGGDRGDVRDNYDLRGKPEIELSKKERKSINEAVKKIIASGKTSSELTDEEKETLRQYTGEGGLSSGTKEALTQFYTPYKVISAIYRALKNSGFNGSKILEPSAGSGNFIGLAPFTNWTAIDIDKTNYEVAKLLYPGATHYNTPYENFKGTGFDLVISNIPFAEVRGASGMKIRPDVKTLHDFFFVHSLDRVKPKGIIAFVTSKGVMDKVDSKIRREIVSKADLLGAYRLPNTTFEKNAHTSVVTDVVFLQRRPDGKSPSSSQKKINDSFINSSKTADDIYINDYYKENPDNVLGEMVVGKSMYNGRPVYDVKGELDSSTLSRIELPKVVKYKQETTGKGADSDKAEMSGIPNKYSDFEEWAQKNNAIYRANDKYSTPEAITLYKENIYADAQGQWYVKDFEHGFTDLGTTVKIYKKLDNNEIDGKLLVLRNLKLSAEQIQSGKPPTTLINLVTQNIESYKDLYKVHPSKDKKLKEFFKSLGEESLLKELSSYITDDWKPKKVFTERTKFTGSGKIKINEKSSLNDRALYNEDFKGIIDFNKKLSYLSKDDIRDLLKNGYAYVDENTLQNEILYYSGNIYKKIESLYDERDRALADRIIGDDNQDIRKAIENQIDKLEEIKPVPKSIDQIDIKGNESWFEQIFKNIARVTVTFDKEKGTKDYTTEFGEVYDNYLSNRQLVPLSVMRDGKEYQLPDAEVKRRLKEANEKIADVKREIKTRINEDPEIKAQILDTYNSRFRAYVKPDYSKAQYIIQDVLDELPKKVNGKPFSLRPNQINWIIKALYEGKGINAHDVGGGKTYAGIVLARALKKKGMGNKPLFVVPAKTIRKWKRDILSLYPKAVIYDLGNLSKEKRTEQLFDIANNQADYVLISHEGFAHLKLPLQKELEYFNKMSGQSLKDEGLTGREKTKQEEKVEKYEQAIINAERDDRLTFDKLGFDVLVTDEAHNYKNIGISSELVKFGAGIPFTINPSKNTYETNKKGEKILVKSTDPTLQSARSYDFRFKAKYIKEMNNGNNVFLLTATPTPNKPMETLTMLRHLNEELLDEYGLVTDTDFANMFLEFGSVATPGGKKNFTNIVTKVKNAIALRDILDRFVDKLSMEQMSWIKLPKAEVVNHYIKLSDDMKDIMEDVKRRFSTAKGFKQNAGDKVDTVIQVYSNARTSSIDPRLYDSEFANVTIYERTYNSDDDKLQKLIENVIGNLKENPKGGQIIFSDLAGHTQAEKGLIPQNLHAEIKAELVKSGVVTPQEVAIISGQEITNFNTGKERKLSGDKLNEAKQELVDLYNEGKIKVIIGTTQSAGEGMDIQVKTTDIHHLDIPYTPKDFTQRNGRGVRFGNENDLVRIHYYFTAGSFDQLSFGIVTRKKGWNEAIWDKEVADEIDTTAEMIGGFPSEKEIAIEMETDPVRKELLKLDLEREHLYKELLYAQEEYNKHLSNLEAEKKFRPKNNERLEKALQERDKVNGQLKLEGIDDATIDRLKKYREQINKDITKYRSYENYYPELEARIQNNIANAKQVLDDTKAKADEFVKKYIHPDDNNIQGEVILASEWIPPAIREQLPANSLGNPVNEAYLRVISTKLKQVFPGYKSDDIKFMREPDFLQRLSEVEGREYKSGYAPLGYVGTDGKIYFNIDRAGTDTPIHEFSHIFWAWAEKNASDIWDKAVSFVEKEPALLQEIAFTYGYDLENKRERRQAIHEVLATGTGVAGAFNVEKIYPQVSSSFKQTVKSLFDSVIRRLKSLFGIADKLEYGKLNGDSTIADFFSAISSDILKGKLIADIKPEEVNKVALTTYESKSQPTSAVKNTIIGKTLYPDIVNGFYSPLEKRIIDFKQEKVSANKWKDIAGKGDEAIYTGILDWLNAKNPAEIIPKSEVLNFLKDNRIEIKEVVKGGQYFGRDLAEKYFKQGKEVYGLHEDGDTEALIETNEDLEDFDKFVLENEVPPNGIGKFEQYQTPGEKENYKEILVTLPTDKGLSAKEEAEYKRLQDLSGQVVQLNRRDENRLGKLANKKFADKDLVFTSSHFDEPNIIVHLRMNTRTDADGKKVLFLEEIQSDWGQKGKKMGFTENVTKENAIKQGYIVYKAETNKKGEEAYFIDNPKDEYFYRKGFTNTGFDTETEAWDELIKQIDEKRDKIPPAPFVTDTNAWVKLGLKVAMKEAVRQGVDKIAWTTGEQQNERYDLSKYVDSVSPTLQTNGNFTIEGFKDGRRIINETNIPKNKIEDYVGKELAEKIIKDAEKQTQVKRDTLLDEYTGQDLKVGGKGMKGFYGNPADNNLGIIGRVAESLFGKGSVENINMKFQFEERYRDIRDFSDWLAENYPDDPDAGYDYAEENYGNMQNEYYKEYAKQINTDTTTVNSVSVTPQMRAQVNDGLPLFQVSAPTEPEMQKIINELKQKSKRPKSTVKLGEKEKNWVNKKWDKWFTSAGMLGEEVFKLANKLSFSINSQLKEVEYTVKDLRNAVNKEYKNKLDTNVVLAIDRYIKGDKSYGAFLPTSVVTIADKMRDKIDTLSIELAKSGAVKEELAKKILTNINSYTHRSYRVHDEPKEYRAQFIKIERKLLKGQELTEEEKTLREVELRARDYIADSYMLMGREISDEELDKKISDILQHDKAQFLNSGQLGKKNLGILKHREDIPAEIRDLLGEYKDPLVNYTKSIAKMVNLIEKHKFLTELRDNGLNKFVFSAPPDKRYVRIAETEDKLLFPLNGYFVHQDLKEAIEKHFEPEQIPDWLRLYYKINGVVKYSKTALAWVTTVRNIISNIPMMTANGYWQVKHGKDPVLNTIGRMFGDKETARQKYIEYMKYGIVEDSALAGEMRAILKDAGMTNGTDQFIRTKIEKIVDGAKKGLLAPGVLYQGIDDFFKIYAFENEVQRYKKAYPNKSDEEIKQIAGEIVRNVLPTYSMIGKLGKLSRRFPLFGTFVSFPAEIIRNSYNIVEQGLKEMSQKETRLIGINRIASAMSTVTSTAVASYISALMFGYNDDDEKRERQFLADWNKNSQLIYVGKKENGQIRFIDISFTDPYSYLKKGITALWSGDNLTNKAVGSLVEFASPFLGEEILAGKILDVMRNKSGQSGKPIYNEDAPAGDKAKDIALHFWDAFEPGTLLQVRRIVYGAMNRTAPSGRVYDMEDELIALSGFRVTKVDVAQSMSFRIYDMMKELQNIRRVYTEVETKKGNVTKEEKEKAFNKANELYQDWQNRLHKLVLDGKLLGVDDREVTLLLKDTGLSKKIQESIKSGTNLQLEPKEYTLKELSVMQTHYQEKIDSLKKKPANVDTDREIQRLQYRVDDIESKKQEQVKKISYDRAEATIKSGLTTAINNGDEEEFNNNIIYLKELIKDKRTPDDVKNSLQDFWQEGYKDYLDEKLSDLEIKVEDEELSPEQAKKMKEFIIKMYSENRYKKEK